MSGRLVSFLLVTVFLAVSCGGSKSTAPDHEPSTGTQETASPEPPFTPPDRYDDFAEGWKKVEEAEKEGKPRTALDEVAKILADARATHNVPQIVKALIHRAKFERQIGEKQPHEQIAEWEQEIAMASFPEKNILHSVVADLYENYFQMNRWRFYERTEGAAEGDDIASWSLQKLLGTITAHHHAALEHAESLRRIPIALFDEIIVKGTRSRALRPTLYDLLAHRAVDFFMNDESAIAESESPFEVSDIAYLLPAERFALLPLTTTDQNSLAWHALRILQDLTRAHLRDRDPAALVEVEIKRLAFVHSRHTAENRDEIYQKTLELLEMQYGAHPTAAARLAYETALFHYEKANAWREGMPEEERMGLRKALDRCAAAILKWPDSEGAELCRALSSQIERKSIHVQAEPAIAPEQPSLVFIKYRNVPKLYFRTVKLAPERASQLTARYQYGGEYEPEKIAKERAALPPRHAWEVTPPDDGDRRARENTVSKYRSRRSNKATSPYSSAPIPLFLLRRTRSTGSSCR